MIILITGGNLFSDNRGINAFTIGCLDFLNKKYPNFQKILLIPFTKKNQKIKYYENLYNIKIIQSHSYINLICWISSKIAKNFQFLRNYIIQKFRILKIFNFIDAVVSLNGGDGFTDAYWSKTYFFLNCSEMLTAINFNKKLILAPQTIGPFKSFLGSYIANKILKKSEKIFVRENVSKKIVNTYVKKEKIHRGYDFAFNLKNNFKYDIKKKVQEKFICINISGLLWKSSINFYNKNANSIKYQEIINEIIKFLINNTNYDILLIPHTYNINRPVKFDDLEAIKECLNKLDSVRISYINEDLNAETIKGIISQSEFFIGSRMHACISALSNAVPTFCIGYSHKFFGILSDFNLSDNFLNVGKENKQEVLHKFLNFFNKRVEIRDIILEKLKKIKNSIEDYDWFDDIRTNIRKEVNHNIHKIRLRNVSLITKLNFCSGCGMCFALCPEKAIEIVKKERNVPKINENLCIGCSLCLKVCPSYNNKIFHNNKKMNDGIFGSYLDLFYGHSTDLKLRYKSSSGGIIKEIVKYLLNNKKVNYAITIIKNPRNPLEPEIVPISRIEDIKSITNSVYNPISMCSFFRNISIFENKKFVFIGKPCEILALNLATKYNEKLKESLYFTIGLFCHHTPNRNATLKLLKSINIKPEQILKISYRGNGWPGYFSLITKDKIHYKLNHIDVWKKFLGREKYNHLRCKLCPDPTAEFADISVGDAWGINNSDNQGNSFLITRSNLTSQLILKMQNKNIVNLSRFNAEKINFFQPNLIIKKMNFGIFSFLLSLFNVPKILPFYTFNKQIPIEFWMGLSIPKRMLLLIIAFYKFRKIYKMYFKSIKNK